jgi:peptidyl-tRNA hydrolase
MYFVVRKDHPLTLARAMALAGAGAVRCADRFRADPHWADAFAAWSPRARKVALRAGADQVEELRSSLDCEPVETELGVTLLALPPRRRSQSEPLLTELRPYTDGPRPAKRGSGDPAGGDAMGDGGDAAGGDGDAARGGHDAALIYVIRSGVLRTAGKAMAQAGHAALMCADRVGPRHPDAFAAWRANGCPGEVRVADLPHWAALREAPDAVVVADAGLTQVEPGTETVIALPPLPDPPPLAADLPLL